MNWKEGVLTISLAVKEWDSDHKGEPAWKSRQAPISPRLVSRLLTGSCSFWWSCVRGSASRSERLFVSDLSWRKSCWCCWNQTSAHYFSPVTNKLLNWGSIYTPLPGSHVCVVLTRPDWLPVPVGCLQFWPMVTGWVPVCGPQTDPRPAAHRGWSQPEGGRLGGQCPPLHKHSHNSV